MSPPHAAGPSGRLALRCSWEPTTQLGLTCHLQDAVSGHVIEGVIHAQHRVRASHGHHRGPSHGTQCGGLLLISLQLCSRRQGLKEVAVFPRKEESEGALTSPDVFLLDMHLASAVRPLCARLCCAPTMCPPLLCAHYVPASAVRPLCTCSVHCTTEGEK